GSDVDDAAVFLRQHRRHHRLAADEGTVQIDAQHLAPFVEVGFPHRLVDAGDAGVVDEDIDLAQRLQRFVTGLLDRGEIGNVDLESRDGRADFPGGLFGKWKVVIPDRDLRARCDQALGDRAPKTLGATGDDGATAVQVDFVHGCFLSVDVPHGEERSCASRTMRPPVPSFETPLTRAPQDEVLSYSVQPPSMTCATPVVNALSSLA